MFKYDNDNEVLKNFVISNYKVYYESAVRKLACDDAIDEKGNLREQYVLSDEEIKAINYVSPEVLDIDIEEYKNNGKLM